MIGKYSIHTTIDLKNENCDGRGYRIVRIAKNGRGYRLVGNTKNRS